MNQDQKQILIGLYCVKADFGYGNRIILRFSENNEVPIESESYFSRMRSEFESEDIFLKLFPSAWSLSQNDTLLTDSKEDYAHRVNGIKNLVEKKLLSVEIQNGTNIVYKFENDFCFTTCFDEPAKVHVHENQFICA